MASAQGYTVESAPGRKRLPWRLPAFILLLLLGAGAYWNWRPYCQVAGHYKGRIGNEYSMEKYQLIVTLSQNGAGLSGQCEISNQTRNQVVVHRASLNGGVKGETFRVSGLLDDGRMVYLEGFPKRNSDGIFLMGETWTEAKGASQHIAFRVERLDGRISPQDLAVKKTRP